MICDCEPDLDDERFARLCDYCGRTFESRVCEHAEHQDPCPECSVLPVPQLVRAGRTSADSSTRASYCGVSPGP